MYSDCMNAGGATYGFNIACAARAIALGHVDAVLVLGAGKFPKVTTAQAEDWARRVAHPEFEAIYGTAIVVNNALLAQRHVAEYGTTASQLAAAAVAARRWALTPRRLHARSGGDHREGRARLALGRDSVSPARLLGAGGGGAAVLVTSGEIARRINPQPAYILRFGEYHGYAHVSQSANYTRSGAAESGPQAFRMAGLTPTDIDVVETYDAFTVHAPVMLENLGFCEPGKAAALIADGTVTSATGPALGPVGQVRTTVGGVYAACADAGSESRTLQRM